VEVLFRQPELPFLKKEIPESDIAMTKVTVSAESQERVRRAIQKIYPQLRVGQSLVLINPNASEFLPQRKWPLEYYTQLIRLIVQHHPEHLILLTGSPAEREEINIVVQGVGSQNCLNFAGEVPFFGFDPSLFFGKSFDYQRFRSRAFLECDRNQVFCFLWP
jgi:ADP-heptose:LPS heptosyltransferase